MKKLLLCLVLILLVCLCENEKFSLKIYVNDVEVNKSERIPLFDKDLIKIVYS